METSDVLEMKLGDASIDRYTSVYVTDLPTERPVAKEAFVLDWAAAGVQIPWPEGLSPREAIIQWAIND